MTKLPLTTERPVYSWSTGKMEKVGTEPVVLYKTCKTTTTEVGVSCHDCGLYEHFSRPWSQLKARRFARGHYFKTNHVNLRFSSTIKFSPSHFYAKVERGDDDYGVRVKK